MSISGALANAVTGLNVASRSIQVVSDNVANAQTEGYGTREIAISSRSLGGAGAGVQVDGIVRRVDQALLQDRRLADASVGYAEGLSRGLDRLAQVAGTPDDAGSISGRLAQLETSLLEAGSRPDSEARLSSVLASARSLSDRINLASDQIRAERLAADASIANQVEALNSGLVRVAEVNDQIAALTGRGQDVSALLDARQRAIDEISDFVPLRILPRDEGRVAIYSANGAGLLDPRPQEVSFQPANVITPDMTLASGALSGLSLNDRDLQTNGPYAPLGGGSLQAAFELRDERAPAAQARLDSIARDLIERFSDPALDLTRTAGEPGLFTDGGGVFDPLDETGLAGRLTINAAFDPEAGGEIWRLRDGQGSTAPGDVGNSELIYAFVDALSENRVPATGVITTASRSAFALTAEFAGLLGTDAVAAEADETFATARLTTLADLELQAGVETDQELQKLLLIEQSYAANAQVIRVAGSLIEQLLEI